MSATGDTQQLGEGDLVLIPPATDHAIANDGEGTWRSSPSSRRRSRPTSSTAAACAQAAGYDDYEDE